MTIGLTESEITAILTTSKKFKDIQQIILYGSRAMGNHKKGSDVDLAIKGKLQADTVTKLAAILNEETFLPYFFDICHYETLENENLKKHINQYGVVLH